MVGDQHGARAGVTIAGSTLTASFAGVSFSITKTAITAAE